MSSQKKLILGIFLTFVGTSLLWIGAGATTWYFFFNHRPPGFDVSIQQPNQVTLGEVFTVKVIVENSTSQNTTLNSIDLYNELLDGFEVVSVSPKPASKDRLWGLRSYYFKKKLLPTDTYEVEFKLKAKKVGYWGGDIDCCTPTEKFVTNYTEIEIIDPSAP